MKMSLVGGAIGALVLVNAGAFAAVHQHFQVPAATASAATASLTPSPSTSNDTMTTPATGTPTGASPAGSASASMKVDAVDPLAVSVIAANGQRAWRAVNSGECSANSSVTVQQTQDGGRTWTTKAAAPAGAMQSISLSGSGRLQLSGQTSGDCSHAVWLLTGDTWSTSSSASWLPAGARSAKVLHGSSTRQACDRGWVIDLAVAGDTADVLCSTGEVRAIPTSGSPKTIYQSADALSIATTGGNTLVVARTAKGCDGVQLVTVAKGSAQPITCVQGASTATDLTFAGDNGWLVAAHNTWTGGVTGDWSKS
ncbi:hypothetical protein [Flexivirga sp.]|uniref:hypothetical protein n=1 Tax=Flexivirga sp. TaxID=1962927 RepID=UPI003F7EE477